MGRKSLAAILLSLAAVATVSPACAACQLVKLGELPVTMEGLSPVIPAKINGKDARLVADTGAFFSALSRSEIEPLHLSVRELPSGLIFKGATGEFSGGLVQAEDFTVLNHTFKRVQFITVNDQFGAGTIGLLGQNFLNIVDTEYDLANGSIRLFHPDGCATSALAYWAAGKPSSVIPIDAVSDSQRRIHGSVTVNGVTLSTMFDTGFPYSELTIHGASRIGIKRGDPRLTPAGSTRGVAGGIVQSWTGPVDSFKIGDEEIKYTRLRMAEIEVDGADMVLGADFFLSHRILVANSQRKLYFSYNGGPVFKLESADGGGQAPPVEDAQRIGADAADTPKDAAGFIRRAHAFKARRQYAQAIADFSQAITLSPMDAKPLYDRAMVHVAEHQDDKALTDLDAALQLKPDDTDALLMRGLLHLRGKRLERAKADLQAVVRQDPKYALEVSDIYTDGQAYAEAIAVLDSWIAASPKDQNLATGLNNRCWTRALWDRELDKALADCDAALKARPGTTSFLDSRGLVYLRMGRFDAAIRDYDVVVRKAPLLAWSRYSRGVGKLRAGQTEQGQADIKAAIGIDADVVAKAKARGLAPALASQP